ncbi:MAG: diguanylate cyclase domain-containing protein, partial [Solirubrobacteraceae bacterium]
MPRRHQPLDLFVTVVVATGVACAVLVLGTGLDTMDRLLTPELALFALCALAGELVPLKVHTRGSEGEVTTSTCFALAMMLAGGPAVALAGLVGASILADSLNGKPLKKIAFNAAQYSVSVTAASIVLVTLTDVPHAGALPFGPMDLIPILGVATVFFVVNSALVSTVVALAQGVIKLGRYLANDLFFQASTAGLLLGLSPVVVLAAEFSLPALLLLLLPFLAVHRGGRAAIAKEHQSLHDALTGLPNRTLFRDKIEQAITGGRRADVASAVMLIDLDHFKEINDTLGHHAGDRLLEEVAR